MSLAIEIPWQWVLLLFYDENIIEMNTGLFHVYKKIHVREHRRGNKKNEQSRKTGNIDEEKQNKNTTQHELERCDLDY